jgi:hypothetical protein
MLAADPSALLVEVASKNEAFARTVKQWDDHGQPSDELHLIQQAQSACMTAIVDYNVVASRYAEVMPPELPKQIDLTQDSLNCSAEQFTVGALQV